MEKILAGAVWVLCFLAGAIVLEIGSLLSNGEAQQKHYRQKLQKKGIPENKQAAYMRTHLVVLIGSLIVVLLVIALVVHIKN